MAFTHLIRDVDISENEFVEKRGKAVSHFFRAGMSESSRDKFSRLLEKSVIPVLFLSLWWCAGNFNLLNTYLFPTPGAVFTAGWDALLSGELGRHALVSLVRVFSGFSLTCLLALPLAVCFCRWPILERFCSVPVEFVRIVPPLAFIPLLILWFGIGESSKLALIVLASFFPVFLNILVGLKNVDKRLLEMGLTIELSQWAVFRYILIPSALPSIITGLRLGFGYSWRAVIGAELIAAASGLGYMILDAEELARTDRVFVGILVIGVLGYLCDALFQKTASGLSQKLHLAENKVHGHG